MSSFDEQSIDFRNRRSSSPQLQTNDNNNTNNTCNPWLELFVPGRICLFGEHTDWSGSFRRFNSEVDNGCTIVTGTNQGLFGKCRQNNSSFIVRSVLPDTLSFDELCLKSGILSSSTKITYEEIPNPKEITKPQRFATPYRQTESNNPKIPSINRFLLLLCPRSSLQNPNRLQSLRSRNQCLPVNFTSR